ncbi:hypothetical protein MRB53_030670 [Persea americana]|uniref:Uncharacterized protein n=1 Tax=Persea americana TaxID=3435 RepID=A0ACC2KLZ5_PERAE|nr:hypothetical protein MRB53_030670 [Persea americana]
MAEIPKPVCEEIEAEAKNMGKMSVSDQDSFVVDMENLSRVGDKKGNSNAKRSLSLKLLRSLSRKGSHGGGEGKLLERETADASSKGVQGGASTFEKSTDPSLMGTTATGPPSITISTIDEIRGRRYNRCSSNLSRHSSWLHPRRVMLFFATLSSMGTIILIYFTLAFSNINQDGVKTQ